MVFAKTEATTRTCLLTVPLEESTSCEPFVGICVCVLLLTRDLALTRYQETKGNAKSNLLSGKESNKSVSDTQQIRSHWIGNLTVNVIYDEVKLKESSIPAQLRGQLFLSEKDESKFEPIVFPHLFWNLKNEAISLEEETESVPFTVSFAPYSFWKFSMLVQFDDSMSMHESFGNNPDDIKEMIRDANPILLAITFVVSLLHSVFDFLAFKNGMCGKDE